MYQQILVPVDGSAASQSAVAQAAGLAKAFGSAVTLAYVIDPYPFTGVGTDFAYGQTQYLGAANTEAHAALDYARDVFAQLGITAATQVVESHSVHRGIIDTAHSVGANLIVMGSHGREGLEKLVLGSVTQRVLSESVIPVLVVRE